MMIRACDMMRCYARWMLGPLICDAMIKCMVGFVCEHDRCMVKDVLCHVDC